MMKFSELTPGSFVQMKLPGSIHKFIISSPLCISEGFSTFYECQVLFIEDGVARIIKWRRHVLVDELRPKLWIVQKP